MVVVVAGADGVITAGFTSAGLTTPVLAAIGATTPAHGHPTDPVAD